MTRTAPLSIPEMIQGLEKRWGDAQKSPHGSLAQLVLLRELSRAVHAEKSWCLASGFPEEAEDLHAIEDKVDGLLANNGFKGSLADVLANPNPAIGPESGEKRWVLPKNVKDIIPSEKLERYDRNWEKAIACEAAKQGWDFWKLSASVQVAEAQACEDSLNKALANHGYILFADTAENSGLSEEFRQGIWPGQWILVIQPGFDCKSIPLGTLKGIVMNTPPQWTLLYR